MTFKEDVHDTPQSKQSRAPEKWRFFFETPPRNCTNMLFFLFFLHVPGDLLLEASENLIFRFKVSSRVRTVRPKLSVFSKISKYSVFVAF